MAHAEKLAHMGSWEWIIANDKMSWSDELFHIHGLTREHFTPSFESYIEQIHKDDLKGALAFHPEDAKIVTLAIIQER